MLCLALGQATLARELNPRSLTPAALFKGSCFIEPSHAGRTLPWALVNASLRGKNDSISEMLVEDSIGTRFQNPYSRDDGLSNIWAVARMTERQDLVMLQSWAAHLDNCLAARKAGQHG